MTATRFLAGLLLRLYPPRFRRAYGEEVLRSLEDDLRDAGSIPGMGRHLARARAIADLARAAPLEWAVMLRQRAAAAWKRRSHPRRSEALSGRPAWPRGRPADGRLRAIVADLRYSCRALRRSPAFTIVSILTVALVIGVATSVFSIVNGIILKPLPYANPDRLVNIWNDLGHGAQSLPAVHPADFRDYQAWSGAFEEFAAASGGTVVQAAGNLTSGAHGAEPMDISTVTANFLPLLGVTPILGRHFTADEERPGGPRVAMLAHALWGQRFGGDPAVVGRAIEIDGRPHTVVGVLPPGFRLHLPAEAFLVKDAAIWLPLSIDYDRLPPRNYTYFTVFGRLKAGVTIEQAQAEMNAIAGRLRREHPVHAASDLRIRVVPLQEDVVKRVRSALLLLQAAVGLVLIIGCVNVANLLVARARALAPEMAVHTALGATRSRIAGRLLMDSFVLAVLGTMVGVALAVAITWAITTLAPANLPRMDSVTIDGTVLLAASLLCLGTALLAGALPAWHAATRDPVSDLKEGAGSSGGARSDRARRVLIIAEVALSLVLLVGAALLVRSAVALHHVSPGFNPAGVLTFRLALPATAYPGSAERRAFLERLEERLRQLPQVDTIGVVSQLPLTGSGPLAPYAFDEETARNWESLTADGRRASPDFFRAIGARLQAGRYFSDEDGSGPPVIIVDDELAQRVWPNEDPVGQRLQIAPAGQDDTHAEVIGVIRQPRLHDLARPVRPQIWRPLLPGVGANLSFAVRARSDPAALGGDVRRAVAEIDPSLAVSTLVPLSTLVAGAGAQSRLSALVMLAFAAMALTLAAVGVYGLVGYSVARRTRELAIRQALGQDPASLRRMVIRQAAGLGVTAVGLGLIAAGLAARLLERFLFEIDPLDPLTFAGASALLLSTVVVAAWVPARQAGRIDPLAALRSGSL